MQRVPILGEHDGRFPIRPTDRVRTSTSSPGAGDTCGGRHVVEQRQLAFAVRQAGRRQHIGGAEGRDCRSRRHWRRPVAGAAETRRAAPQPRQQLDAPRDRDAERQRTGERPFRQDRHRQCRTRRPAGTQNLARVVLRRPVHGQATRGSRRTERKRTRRRPAKPTCPRETPEHAGAHRECTQSGTARRRPRRPRRAAWPSAAPRGAPPRATRSAAVRRSVARPAVCASSTITTSHTTDESPRMPSGRLIRSIDAIATSSASQGLTRGEAPRRALRGAGDRQRWRQSRAARRARTATGAAGRRASG